ncbi:DUF3159 domain-containing protein [Kribbella sandramycini]|uniref:DUF3159 domain-containing protein n=1 Tax=Kribbella sandramycini TaxID=60450 RepID=A0A7Y4KYX4_9ACTN|nr:DUF3159 domain-containing protein [Kribbella sandramycini]MBB6568926.1 hypothetical protein [Kribbella sandramycini]NOL41228.1 DUF3159 domain-containing protein [Kribbella sandramycini]
MAERTEQPKKTNSKQVLGWLGTLADIGLPWIAFTVAYAVTDHDLKLSLIIALSTAGLVGLVRLIRKQPIANVIGGVFGVGLSAFVASRTGQAEDVFLPGILMNCGWFVLYALTIVTRYPLIGLLYGAVTQTWLAWRRDPELYRALNRVTLLLTAQIGVRLAIMVPLYLADNVSALGVAKVALGLPFYGLTVWVGYIVLRSSLSPDKWEEVKENFTHMLKGTQPTPPPVQDKVQDEVRDEQKTEAPAAKTD